MRDRRVLRAALAIWLVQQLVLVTVVIGGFRPSTATMFAIQAVILMIGFGAARWYLSPRSK